MTEPEYQPDELDEVAGEIRAAVTGELPPGATPEGIAAQAEAAAALQAATMASLEDQDAPTEPRSIPALATTTGVNRIGAGHVAVMIHVPNDLAAQILDERLDAALADTVTPAVMLDTIADHIHHIMPASLGPPTVDLWRARIERTQAEDLGRIDQDKLDNWPHGDSEVRP